MANGNRGYRKWIELLGAVTGAATLIYFGYTISWGQLEANLKWLKSKNTDLEAKLEAANATISDLNTQLLQALSESINSKPKRMNVEVQESNQSVESPKSSVETSRSETIEVVVQEGSSANLFDGRLFVSVIGTTFESAPYRHTVLAKIGAPGQEGLEIDRKEIGYSVIYKGYEVRILAAGTFSAKFLVREVE